MIRSVLACTLCILCAPLIGNAQSANDGIPHLQKHGTATELVVNGKPFLMLAGELRNSSASSLDYMRPIWPKLAAIPLNTVLTPVYWELVEPTEGKFDFTLVDGLIHQARENHVHIVFLWFGAWKNGWSSNSPLWVKEDAKRFPLVIEKDGKEDELLSPLGMNTLQAEKIAYAALMRHIREVDGQEHTVVMMQVENEVHLLSDSRDYSPVANEAFNLPVPAQLLDYIQQHKNALFPQFKKSGMQPATKHPARGLRCLDQRPTRCS
ncbi:MAG TPA: beta-galactosidase [Terriglobales bacterium]|nr:beta-galactosidase [Terriglobales bacterium]